MRLIEPPGRHHPHAIRVRNAGQHRRHARRLGHHNQVHRLSGLSVQFECLSCGTIGAKELGSARPAVGVQAGGTVIPDGIERHQPSTAGANSGFRRVSA